MTIEEFFLSKFEGLSVSASLFLLAFAILRYASAQNKQSGDVAKSALQLASQTDAGQSRLVEALDKNTTATDASNSIAVSIRDNLNAIGIKSFAEHEETQRIAEDVRAKLVEFVADYSQLKATVIVTMEGRKEDSKALAKIGLEMSSLQNKLDEIIGRLFPNPASTQEIPETIHVEARIISEIAPPEEPKLSA